LVVVGEHLLLLFLELFEQLQVVVVVADILQ
jgi:hypothetical protein